jgi:hypothetical protein
MFNKDFAENCACYGIVWKNIADLDKKKIWQNTFFTLDN